jgi:hypothetical protein
MTRSIGAPSPFVPYLRTPMVVRRRKVMADWPRPFSRASERARPSFRSWASSDDPHRHHRPGLRGDRGHDAAGLGRRRATTRIRLGAVGH